MGIDAIRSNHFERGRRQGEHQNGLFVVGYGLSYDMEECYGCGVVQCVSRTRSKNTPVDEIRAIFYGVDVLFPLHRLVNYINSIQILIRL